MVTGGGKVIVEDDGGFGAISSNVTERGCQTNMIRPSDIDIDT